MTTPLSPVRAASVRCWRGADGGDLGSHYEGPGDVEYVARPADIDAALLARVEALERENATLVALLGKTRVYVDDMATWIDDDDTSHYAASSQSRATARDLLAQVDTALAPARTKGEDGA